MKLVFRWEGNTPSKKNQKRLVAPKGRRPLILPSEAYKAWHGPALKQMALQRSAITGVTFPIDHCLRIYAKLFYENFQRRDSSNTFESIMDLLVDAGILADDCWAITGPTAQFPELRKGRPGWEIILELRAPAPGLAEDHRYQETPKA